MYGSTVALSMTRKLLTLKIVTSFLTTNKKKKKKTNTNWKI